MGRHIFLSINRRKCCCLNVLLLFMNLSEKIQYLVSNYFINCLINLIYTTGMTLHSSGNSSSQVPLKENGRFTKYFSPHFHHIFSLVPYETVLGLVMKRLQVHAKDFRPYVGVKESKENCILQHHSDVMGPII